MKAVWPILAAAGIGLAVIGVVIVTSSRHRASEDASALSAQLSSLGTPPGCSIASSSAPGSALRTNTYRCPAQPADQLNTALITLLKAHGYNLSSGGSWGCNVSSDQINACYVTVTAATPTGSLRSVITIAQPDGVTSANASQSNLGGASVSGYSLTASKL